MEEGQLWREEGVTVGEQDRCGGGGGIGVYAQKVPPGEREGWVRSGGGRALDFLLTSPL